jgi:hypothetical protein
MRFLERYQAGEHEAVWRELAALGEISNAEILADAEAVARETMSRVARNIDFLIPRLRQDGFRFGESGGGRRAASGEPLRNPPTEAVQERIAWLESTCGRLPLSLKVWFQQVGGVNLLGWNPNWLKIASPRTGREWVQYLSLEIGQLASHGSIVHPYFEVGELDPLLLPGLDDRLAKYWIEEHADWNDALATDRSPFELDLSPDHDMKDEGSGGSYNITTGASVADASFLGEWREVTFVEYLRATLQSAGMGGLGRFELMLPMKKRIAELIAGLGPF